MVTYAHPYAYTHPYHAGYYGHALAYKPYTYYANSGGAVHIVKREAESAPEAEADPKSWYSHYGYGYRYPYTYGAYSHYYRPYTYGSYGYRAYHPYNYGSYYYGK